MQPSDRKSDNQHALRMCVPLSPGSVGGGAEAAHRASGRAVSWPGDPRQDGARRIPDAPARACHCPADPRLRPGAAKAAPVVSARGAAGEARRRPHPAGGLPRQGGADRFLGHLVRAVPRVPALLLGAVPHVLGKGSRWSASTSTRTWSWPEFLAREPLPSSSSPRARRAAEVLDLDKMPTAFLLDRDGVVRYRHEGFEPGSEEELRRNVEELLRRGQVARARWNRAGASCVPTAMRAIRSCCSPSPPPAPPPRARAARRRGPGRRRGPLRHQARLHPARARGNPREGPPKAAELAKAHGGYAQVLATESAVVRVPESKLDAFLAQVPALGKVTDRRISAET